MALVHDLGESVIGDITPHCGVSHDEKLRREREAMLELCKQLSTDTGSEVMELWTEFNDGKSLDAQVCRDLDKFEMLLQAFEYERDTDRAGMLEDFFASSASKLDALKERESIC